MCTRWAASSVAVLKAAASIRGRHFLTGESFRGARGFPSSLSLPPRIRGLSRLMAPVCATEGLASMIQQKNVENSVIVYSRSWCPFCSDMRQLLDSYNVEAKFVELDSIVEGDDIQNTLTSMTGSGTVPQVFIGGQFIGGFDDAYTLHQQGKLKSLLEGAGAKFTE